MWDLVRKNVASLPRLDRHVCTPFCHHSNPCMPSVIAADPSDAQNYFSLNRLGSRTAGDRIFRQVELLQTAPYTRSQSQEITLNLQVGHLDIIQKKRLGADLMIIER